MKAMIMTRVVSLLEEDAPLELAELPVPDPHAGEILIKISACGVCHTELDEIEGRLPPPQLPLVPGHQIVGTVAARGNGTSSVEGSRIGVGWIHHSSGDRRENIHPSFTATGLDVNGGYAEYMTVPETYVYAIPSTFSDTQAAPLLCAGAIGFRALKLAKVEDDRALGLMGFGGSAHLVLQLARHLYPNTPVYIFARDEESRSFARALGAEWAGDTSDRAPELLDAIIDTTPAWKPVVEALANLKPGGRLVVNAIRKEEADKEELLKLSYHEHLWMEREIKSVANITHYDITEFLPLAAEIPIRTEVQTYALEDANRALVALKREPVRGAKVLLV